MIRITRRYHFEAAHYLPFVAADHKCKRMHGHNYELEVTCGGVVDRRGFILDFAELDEVVNPFIAQVDHRTLNDIVGLENPTAELIGDWFLTRIAEKIPSVLAIRVYETKDCWADVTE